MSWLRNTIHIMVDTSTQLKKQQRKFKAGKCCEFCGEKCPPFCMTVDHIIPRAFYGDAWDDSNWQVLCLDCHRVKTTMETLILSGQSDLVPQRLYDSMKGLKEFRDKSLEVRQKLNIKDDNRIPMTHNQFEAAGVKFNK